MRASTHPGPPTPLLADEIGSARHSQAEVPIYATTTVATQHQSHPSSITLDQVIQHWAFRALLGAAIAVLIAIGGYAFNETMRSIKDGISEVHQTVVATDQKIGTLDTRVSELETTRTAHSIYIQNSLEWQKDMARWREEMSHHEHKSNGAVKIKNHHP